jgi:adenylate cyclase
MKPEATERKLAAILAADVVGYSRLMGVDEEATVRNLSASREVIDGLVAAHRGRVFGTAGDSVVAEFASPVEAVRCAVEIQDGIDERSADEPENRRMRFRIGVNLGDVVVMGDNLLGDGVNLAARLEALAEPGGIYVSGAVYEQVRRKVRLRFDDLGDQPMKNIEQPIRVYRVQRNAGAESPLPAGRTEPRLPAKPSIAVLPFENLGGDPEQAYFADGITEDLITEISRFQELFVIARNSAFVYKGKAVKVQDVGRELNVRYILEGSVRKAGNRVRISAQLIEAETGHHLWAERFDRDLEDIFAVQDEVTRRIVAALAGKLAESERRRVRHDKTQCLEAYDCVLRGREIWMRFSPEANQEARRLYEHALELDPDYARAYASLSWTYLLEYLEGWTDAPKQALERALEVARRGAEVNPASHSNHLALGRVYLYMGKHDTAIQALETALSLNPNDADSYVFLSFAITYDGRPEEAVELVEKAMQLNPSYPRWYVWDLGIALYVARRYEEAVKTLKRSEPPNAMVYRWLAASYAQLGRESEAGEAAAEYLKRTPDFSIAKHLEIVPFRNAEDRDHYLDGLRKAGLPE